MKKQILFIYGLGIILTSIGLSAQAGNNENGEDVYNTTCVACHGEKGKGEFPGIPDFTKSGGRLTKSDDQLFNSIKFGFQTPGSIMEMPALGGNPDITDQEVREVITYIKKFLKKK